MIEISEHDDTPNDGVPGGLPDSERILWQGKPDWHRLAVRALQLRKVAVYFLALLIVRQLLLWRDGATLADAAASALQTVVLAGIATGLLALLGWLLARSSVYTLTSRRLIMSFGVALPVSLNLPFSRLAAGDLREFADGSGDIVLRPLGNEKLSFIVLWPHVKPFSIGRAQPMLRALPEVKEVAGILADAIAADAGRAPRRAAAETPRPEAAPDEAASGRRGLGRLLEYPTGPLAAASALVVIAFVSVALFRVAGDVPDGRETAPTVAEVKLRFEDREDGSVLVVDAETDDVLDTLAPGTNGFVRSTLRGLARARRAQQAGSEAPFTLKRLATGRVLLSDPVTGRDVDVYAFGRSNAGALTRFLEPAGGSAAAVREVPISEPVASTMTTGAGAIVAGQTIEEARQ